MKVDRALWPFFVVVDVGFILYWLVTGLHLLPDAWLYKDYQDPVLVAWNWSFLPLDLAVSATGLSSLYLFRREDERWRALAIASLALTFASGLTAIAFWAVRGDFDPGWWAPNLFLMLYPLPFFAALVWRPPVALIRPHPAETPVISSPR